MRFSWILCLACASVPWWCEATPLPFNTATESSGDQDPDMPATAPSTTPSQADTAPLHTTPWVLSHSPAQPSDSTGVEHFLLAQMRGFLQENMVLILLVSSLMAAGIFLVCCASALSRQRKFAAYYPSSFPATCYVDERDKAGGEPAFRHVPNRPPDAPAADPRDSAHQLQQEILSAARKLRTPTKTPTGGRGTRSAKQGPPVVPKSKKETPAELGQEVTPTETEKQMAPTEIEQEVPPTEIEQEVPPTEKEQEVSPTEIEQEVPPAEIEQEVPLTEIEQEVPPAEIEQGMPPTEIEQEVPPTEIEQEAAPTETEQEVKEALQEADQSQSVESEEVSGMIKELGAQQEMRSSPAETQEVGASSVKLIGGETTAF